MCKVYMYFRGTYQDLDLNFFVQLFFFKTANHRFKRGMFKVKPLYVAGIGYVQVALCYMGGLFSKIRTNALRFLL